MRVGGALAALLVTMAAGGASPVAAQDTRTAGDVEAWEAERAFLEIERLQAEIRTLRALAAAQEALLAWNRERAGSGGAPAVLPRALCAEESLARWCRALPETFGADAGGDADNRQRREGER